MGNRTGDILLIGGGHAHLAVLADWIGRGLPYARATLITPHRRLRYSGTVPGWIAGQYDRDTGLLDLSGLTARAGVDLVLDRCVRIDPEARIIESAQGRDLSFDIASIDTGGVGRATKLLGDDPRIIDIRPIDHFVDELGRHSAAERIAVIGGGAGGTELAFALRNAACFYRQPDIAFVTGAADLLPDFAAAVRGKVEAELQLQGIEVIVGDASIKAGQLHVESASCEPVDLIVAAMGSGAPDWPARGGLACDQNGFIAVDRFQRSISHPHVLAVGDVAARQDRRIAHSGVHAVFAGPVLADNLRMIAAGLAPRRSYTPRWNNLYLISTGRGEAIASYGPFAAQGRWVSRLKHWIDNRWLSQYAALAQHAAMAKPG